MHIRFALTEAKRSQGAGLVSATRYADKEVVKFSRHGLVCQHGGRFTMIHNSNLQTGAWRASPEPCSRRRCCIPVSQARRPPRSVPRPEPTRGMATATAAVLD